MTHSGEDEPKYSSPLGCVFHLKWTFPDLDGEPRASPSSSNLPSPNEYIIRVAPPYEQVNVMLK